MMLNDEFLQEDDVTVTEEQLQGETIFINITL